MSLLDHIPHLPSFFTLSLWPGEGRLRARLLSLCMLVVGDGRREPAENSISQACRKNKTKKRIHLLFLYNCLSEQTLTCSCTDW